MPSSSWIELVVNSSMTNIVCVIKLYTKIYLYTYIHANLYIINWLQIQNIMHQLFCISLTLATRTNKINSMYCEKKQS